MQKFAQAIGYKQLKLALLSSVNNPNKKIFSATEAEKIKLTFERIGNNDLLIEGPLTFENATDMESVIKNNLKSEIAGDVDASRVFKPEFMPTSWIPPASSVRGTNEFTKYFSSHAGNLHQSTREHCGS